MRWKQGRRSENVEDRRNAAGPSMAMGGVSVLARILPLLLQTKGGRILLVIGLAGYFGAKLLGIDLLQLGAGGNGLSSNQQLSPKDQELAEFVSVILADTESTWHLEFQKGGLT